MPIWRHLLLNLLALASLLLMPYVFLAVGLLIAYGWTHLRHHWHHHHPVHPHHPVR